MQQAPRFTTGERSEMRRISFPPSLAASILACTHVLSGCNALLGLDDPELVPLEESVETDEGSPRERGCDAGCSPECDEDCDPSRVAAESDSITSEAGHEVASQQDPEPEDSADEMDASTSLEGTSAEGMEGQSETSVELPRGDAVSSPDASMVPPRGETDGMATDGMATDAVQDEVANVDGGSQDPTQTEVASDVSSEPEPEPEPETCNVEGRYCDGTATALRYQCVDGQRVNLPPCPNGQLCDSTSPVARCVDVVEACVGRTPGVPFCDGSSRTICGQDLVTARVSECASVPHCLAGSGAACAVCLDGEYACQGTDLMTCASDNQSFVFSEQCDAADECNPAVGECTSFACDTAQLECWGDDLMVCNSDRSGFELQEACDAFLCDSTTLECNNCYPSDTWCADASTSASCSADGEVIALTPCPSGRPICTVMGLCMECGSPTDCESVECMVATCNSGTGDCEYSPDSAGTACAGGVCDGDGECVECVGDEDCAPGGACGPAGSCLPAG